MDQNNNPEIQGIGVAVSEQHVMPQQVESHKRKKIGIFVLVGLVIFLILGIGGWAFFSKKNSIANQIPTPQPTSTIAPTQIEEDLTLNLLITKDEFTKIPETSYEVKLKDPASPNESCVDCQTDTVLTVKGADVVDRDVRFSCGGIASVCTSSLELEGIDVQIGEQVDDKSIYIIVRYPR